MLSHVPCGVEKSNGLARSYEVGSARDRKIRKIAHPGNRTPVSTVGGYYDTTTPDAILDLPVTLYSNLTS